MPHALTQAPQQFLTMTFFPTEAEWFVFFRQHYITVLSIFQTRPVSHRDQWILSADSFPISSHRGAALGRSLAPRWVGVGHRAGSEVWDWCRHLCSVISWVVLPAPHFYRSLVTSGWLIFCVFPVAESSAWAGRLGWFLKRKSWSPVVPEGEAKGSRDSSMFAAVLINLLRVALPYQYTEYIRNRS